MEEHIERNKRVLEQWERFHRQEPVDESAVRPLILRSWKRCRLQGVRPDNASKVSLSPAALEKLLDQNEDLVAVAKSIMEKLYNPISTSRSFISLSDAQGIVLHALWDNTGSYPIPHLAPGNLAAESASGTNAIGTCLVEHTPVETLASEHYCRSFHGWFCSAAPIRDSRNAIVGVLNVTLPSALYHHHTRGMMEAAAHAIAEQLRLRLLLQEQKAIIEMLDEGVVVLEGEGTIRTLNNKAQAMLGLPPDAVHGNIQDIIFSSDIIRAILSESGQFSDQEAFLQLKGGSLNCMLSLTRLESGKGRVLTLRETKRIKESRRARHRGPRPSIPSITLSATRLPRRRSYAWPACGPERCDHPHPRGKRHGQGTFRAVHPQWGQEGQRAFRRGELRGAAAQPRAERAFRL